MPAKSSRLDGFIEGNPPPYHRVVEEGDADGVTRAESTMPRGLAYLKSLSGFLHLLLVVLTASIVSLCVVFSTHLYIFYFSVLGVIFYSSYFAVFACRLNLYSTETRCHAAMCGYSFLKGLAYLFTSVPMALLNTGNATSTPYIFIIAILGFATGVVSLTKAFLDGHNMKTRRGRSPRAVISWIILLLFFGFFGYKFRSQT